MRSGCNLRSVGIFFFLRERKTQQAYFANKTLKSFLMKDNSTTLEITEHITLINKASINKKTNEIVSCTELKDFKSSQIEQRYSEICKNISICASIQMKYLQNIEVPGFKYLHFVLVVPKELYQTM